MKKKRPPEFGPAHPADIAFDIDGTPLSLSPGDVRRRVLSALDHPDSDIVLVVLRDRGDLVVQVMGDPSQETLAMLEQVRDSYARIVKGQ